MYGIKALQFVKLQTFCFAVLYKNTLWLQENNAAVSVLLLK